jgi:hypothetical protein
VAVPEDPLDVTPHETPRPVGLFEVVKGWITGGRCKPL